MNVSENRTAVARCCTSGSDLNAFMCLGVQSGSLAVCARGLHHSHPRESTQHRAGAAVGSAACRLCVG